MHVTRSLASLGALAGMLLAAILVAPGTYAQETRLAATPRQLSRENKPWKGHFEATFQPVPLEQAPFHQRAETKRDGAVHVSAVALSAEESSAVFGVPLAEDGIQPVWLRIENGEDFAYFFFPVAVDPNHFSPQEAA